MLSLLIFWPYILEDYMVLVSLGHSKLIGISIPFHEPDIYFFLQKKNIILATVRNNMNWFLKQCNASFPLYGDSSVSGS